MSELPKQSTSEWQPTNKQFHTLTKNSINKVTRIDRENIVEEYRNLRQRQQEFLSRINMKTQLKQQLYGFPASRYCKPVERAEEVILQINPFNGKLVIDERKWFLRESQRAIEQQKRKKQKQKLSLAQLNIGGEKETFRMETQHMILQKEEDNMGNWLDDCLERDKEISQIPPTKRTLPNFDSADEMIKL